MGKNPTVNGSIDLLEKSKNHVKRSTTLRNTDITKTCYDFHSAARVLEAAQVAAKEQGKDWVLKYRLQTYKNEQSSALDVIITKTEIIHKYEQDLYNRLAKPQKGYQFRPIEVNKPPKLTMAALKTD